MKWRIPLYFVGSGNGHKDQTFDLQKKAGYSQELPVQPQILNLDKFSSDSQDDPTKCGKQFPCDLCDKVFSSTSSRMTHQKIVHGSREGCLATFMCHICNKTFLWQSKLMTHMRVHSHDRPFGCQLCDKRYKHKKDLKLHLQFHDHEFG